MQIVHQIVLAPLKLHERLGIKMMGLMKDNVSEIKETVREDKKTKLPLKHGIELLDQNSRSIQPTSPKTPIALLAGNFKTPKQRESDLVFK